MKRKEINELSALNFSELKNRLNQTYQELVELRMALYSGKSRNWRGLSLKKDDIARIQSIMSLKKETNEKN